MPHRPLKPLELVVRELGRFPMGAFIFIQECVGAASEEVHGPLSPDQAHVAQWLTRGELSPEDLGRLNREGRLPPDIHRALQEMGGPEKMNRHVSGQQLCWAIRNTALRRWGMMARGVLARWGLHKTDDIGAIVFALVENEWLHKQPNDSISDFTDVFSFDEAFEENYRIGVSEKT